MKYQVTIGERALEVELGAEGTIVDGRAAEATLAGADGTPVRCLRVGAETYRLVADRGARGAW
jgi:hypothetical protein